MDQNIKETEDAKIKANDKDKENSELLSHIQKMRHK